MWEHRKDKICRRTSFLVLDLVIVLQSIIIPAANLTHAYLSIIGKCKPLAKSVKEQAADLLWSHHYSPYLVLYG